MVSTQKDMSTIKLPVKLIQFIYKNIVVKMYRKSSRIQMTIFSKENEWTAWMARVF